MSTTITRLNPDQSHETPGYHHVTIVESGLLAFPTGQCPLDRSGKVVACLGFRGQLVELDLTAALPD